MLYHHKDLFAEYQRNAMLADFSWERTAVEYVRVYEQALFLETMADVSR
ncbi:MAG TPA: hypothetical protein VK846_02130 [Candidatus Limnocylindria bacterium]|nr:hypothetical protein [Candidatus Limnocylindria bacterium]